MSAQVLVVALLVGSGAIGLWTAVRYPRLTPRTAGRAMLCFVAAMVVPAFALPLLALTVPLLPPAAAVLLSVLPVFVLASTLNALAVRFLLALLGSGLR